MNRQSREIVGCFFVGNRYGECAIGLWQSLPECYFDVETFVDFWKAYDAIFHSKSPHRVDKRAVKLITSNVSIKPQDNAASASTLSFSKRLANHIVAIWLFIHH